MIDDQKISFNNLPEVIAVLLQKVEGLERSIQELKNVRADLSQNELLTRQETADYFKCDLSTIHLWTVKKKLNKKMIGNRVYYKRSDVESALKNSNQ